MTRFTPILLNWYETYGRTDLPWRNTNDPYMIWVSEIILQQTRVAQGLNYYLRFIQEFPTFHDLALAPEDDVLRIWQGLGYYSRARNMHKAAQMIATQGEFPTNYDDIRKLKGVGDYTAAAISSFAYNSPYAVVDGNVFRVLSRYFGIETPIDTTQGKKEFTTLAYKLIDKKNPGKYNSAIMDFGALQCTPKSPKCSNCPLQNGCYAFNKRICDELPIRNKKIKLKERYFVYVIIISDGHIFLHKRGGGDIWQGLYEPLLFEFNQKTESDVILSKVKNTIAKKEIMVSSHTEGITHNLTHQKLFIDFYEINVGELHLDLDGFIKVKIEDIAQYGLPQIVHKYLNKIFATFIL